MFIRAKQSQEHTPQLRALSSPSVMRQEGSFLSWDFLGLSSHAQVIRAAHEALEEAGKLQSCAPLVLGGNSPFYEKACELCAQAAQCEDALIFPSWTQAWLSLIVNIFDEGDKLIADEALGLGVLADSAVLADIPLTVCPIEVPGALAEALSAGRGHYKALCLQAACRGSGRLTSLESAVQLCESRGMWVIVDETATFGVAGEKGGGRLSQIKGPRNHRVIIAALGLAVPGNGAVVAGPQKVIDILRASSRALRLEIPPSYPSLASTCEALALRINQTKEYLQIMGALGILASSINPHLKVNANLPILSAVFARLAQAEQLSHQAALTGIFVGIEEVRKLGNKQWHVRAILNSSHSERHIAALREFFHRSSPL